MDSGIERTGLAGASVFSATDNEEMNLIPLVHYYSLSSKGLRTSTMCKAPGPYLPYMQSDNASSIAICSDSKVALKAFSVHRISIHH